MGVPNKKSLEDGVHEHRIMEQAKVQISMKLDACDLAMVMRLAP
jgi:hypothetical protein